MQAKGEHKDWKERARRDHLARIQYADARDYQCGEPSSAHLEVLVQRPQHHANVSRIYQSLDQVKATLLNFGIAEKGFG